MPIITAGNIYRAPEPLEPEDFAALVEGLAVLSVEPFESHSILFSLSTGLKLRIYAENDQLFLNVEPREWRSPPPLVFRIPSPERDNSLEAWRREFTALERLHAITYLIETRELEKLGRVLPNPRRFSYHNAARYLPAEARLSAESIGRGSFIAAVVSYTQRSYKSLIRVIALVFPQARAALMRRIEAETRLREIAVQRAVIQQARDEFELRRDQIDAAISLADRLGPDLTAAVAELVRPDIAALMGGSAPRG